MKIFKQYMSFLYRFQTIGTCCYFLLLSFFLIHSTIKLSYLTNLVLINVFFAEVRSYSFGVCNASV